MIDFANMSNEAILVGLLALGNTIGTIIHSNRGKQLKSEREMTQYWKNIAHEKDILIKELMTKKNTLKNQYIQVHSDLKHKEGELEGIKFGKDLQK